MLGWLVASANWEDAVIALAPTIAAVVAAVIAWLNRRELKGPNGETVAKIVDEGRTIARRNHAIIRRELGSRAGDRAAELEHELHERVDDDEPPLGGATPRW